MICMTTSILAVSAYPILRRSWTASGLEHLLFKKEKDTFSHQGGWTSVEALDFLSRMRHETTHLEKHASRAPAAVGLSSRFQALAPNSGTAHRVRMVNLQPPPGIKGIMVASPIILWNQGCGKVGCSCQLRGPLSNPVGAAEIPRTDGDTSAR